MSSEKILDPIDKARNEVLADGNPIDWFIISDNEKGNELEVKHKGVGGLEGLKEKLDDSLVQYGYLRIEYTPDAESKRVKYVMIIWIGNGAKIMRRGRVNVERSGIAAKFNPHKTFTASDKDELTEGDMLFELQKNGAGNYNGGRG